MERATIGQVEGEAAGSDQSGFVQRWHVTLINRSSTTIPACACRTEEYRAWRISCDGQIVPPVAGDLLDDARAQAGADIEAR